MSNYDPHNWELIRSHFGPDKYERYVGIDRPVRSWMRCMNCGIHHQKRNYDVGILEKIYLNGYRSRSFRGKPIKDQYLDIKTLPLCKSENHVRFLYFSNHIEGSVLDIGSGLGVWPEKLRDAGYGVHCVEENRDSIEFIHLLGLRCTGDIPSERFDCVTLIHILEHIQDPVAFLENLKNSAPKIFIEVPDALEFNYLHKDHDEFNSCHIWFFNPQSLIDTVEKAGWKMIHLARIRTVARDLSRLMMIAEAL